MGFRLSIRNLSIRRKTGPRSLKKEFIFVPKRFPSESIRDPVTNSTQTAPIRVHFFVLGDLSCIREVAHQLHARMNPADRIRLEDFFQSFPAKRKGRDDNKFFPVNALTPGARQKSYIWRQWRVLRQVSTSLEAVVQSLLPIIQLLFPNQTIRVRPYVRQLEVAQDVFFATCKHHGFLIFERMAFMCRLVQDNLLCRKPARMVGRYPRALTEYAFARSPIKRTPYRYDHERLLELRSSGKYQVAVVAQWMAKHVVPTVYLSSPINFKDKFPDVIAIHAYPGVRIPENVNCDLFRIESRFTNRLGSSGQNLIEHVRQFYREAGGLFPRDIDYQLVVTQRPLTIHRLMYGVCRTVGLSRTDYLVLCKGGAIRPTKRRLDFSNFKPFFEQRRRTR